MSFWLLSPFCFVISFNSSFVVWVSGSAGVWQGQLLWNLDWGWMPENLLATCCLRHSLRFYVFFEEAFLSTAHLTCVQYLLDMYWIHVNLFNYELKWSITAHFVGRQRFFVGVKTVLLLSQSAVLFLQFDATSFHTKKKNKERNILSACLFSFDYV